MSMPYTLIRTSRRTLALVIDSSGSLIVRAPRRMPLREIEAFITLKEHWILKKKESAQERSKQQTTQALHEASTLSVGGEALTVSAADVSFAFVYHGTLLLPSAQPLHKALTTWLLGRAEVLLTPLVAAQEARTGLHAMSLHFSSARTRWGSMNAAGAMRLNIALLLCPTEIIDYVIVHELAHLRHPNHSSTFWALVEQLMPDYRQQRAWLKRNQHLIQWLHPPLTSGT